MWRTQTVPSALLRTKLILLPKPTGGERGISLMEEMVKALDALLYRRIMHAVKADKLMSDFLSPANRAYKRGTSCSDILLAHSCIKEDAVHGKSPLVTMMMDLAKFFDTVQLDVVEAVLRIKKAPDKVIAMIRALYHESDITVHCQYGATAPIRRSIGIHQGSALSCLLCLLALEPYLRYMESIKGIDAYITTEGEVALTRAFCDDVCEYAGSVQGLQRRIQLAAPVLEACGIGVDNKVLITAYNIDLRQETNKTITLPSYNRLTGQVVHHSIPVLNGPTTAYRLLGAHFRGAHIDFRRAPDLVRQAKAKISRIAAMGLPADITKQLVRSSVISAIAGHAVLQSPLTAEHLSNIDTYISILGKHTVGLSATTSRGMVFANEREYGLGFPSAVVEFLASTARELLVTLEDDSYEGRLTRANYCRGIRCSNYTGQLDTGSGAGKGFLLRAMLMLASYGFYVHHGDEARLSRLLTVLRRLETDKLLLTATAAENKHQRRINLTYAPDGYLARRLRRWLHREQQQQETQPLYMPLTAEEDELPVEYHGPGAAEIIQAIRTAQAEAQEDISGLFQCFSLDLPEPEDAQWQENTPPNNDQRTSADARIRLLTQLKLQQDIANALSNQSHLSPIRQHLLFTATDGGDNGAAWILMGLDQATLPSASFETQRIGDLIQAAFNKHSRGTPPGANPPYKIIAARAGRLPARIGTSEVCSYDTELSGVIMDFMARELFALGPHFIDNQSVQELAARYRSTSSRERNKLGKPHLLNALHHLQNRLKQHGTQASQPTIAYHQLLIEAQKKGWSTDGKLPPAPNAAFLCLDSPCHHLLTKIASHQKAPTATAAVYPCTAAFYGNQAADDLATDVQLLPAPKDINIPPFYNRFNLLHRGKLVVTYPSKYIRQQGCADSLKHAGNIDRASSQGLGFYAQEAIHPAAKNLLLLDDGLDRPQAHRHFLRSHFSWSHLHHCNRLCEEDTEHMYERLFSAHMDAISMDDGISNRALLCPFCLSSNVLEHGGATHYLSNSCCNPTIKKLLNTFYHTVRNALKTIAPEEAWLDKNSHRASANGHGGPSRRRLLQ